MTTYVSDTFADTNGTTLQAHTPTTAGGVITKNPTSAADALIDSNRVYANNATAIYTYATTPGTDARATGVFVCTTDTGSSTVSIGLRQSATVATGVFLRYSTLTDSWELYDLNAGTLTSLGVLATPMTAGTSQTAVLTAVGNQVSAVIGASTLGPFTTSITAGGQAGIRGSGTTSATAGMRLDSLIVDDIPVTIPVNTAAPVVTGTRVVGYTLSSTNGTWTGTGITYTYSWLIDGVAIASPAETSSTYVQRAGDVGHTITCQVTATNAGGAASATSNGIVVLAAMATGDVQWLYSGTGNLGGAPGAAITDPRTIFDDVFASEAVAGDIEYRAVYLKNAHAVQSLTSVLVWLSANTSSPDTDLAIGVATESASANVAAVTDEQTAPVGVTFSAPSTSGAGLSMGTIPAGSFKGLWLRRTVNAGAAVTGTDTATRNWQGVPA